MIHVNVSRSGSEGTGHNLHFQAFLFMEIFGKL